MGTFSPRDAIIPFWVWQGIYNGCNFASGSYEKSVIYWK